MKKVAEIHYAIKCILIKLDTCVPNEERLNFIHCQVMDGMVNQHIHVVGIPMGTNCAPLMADLFLYCYERDFMSNLWKSKRFDLIDK